MEYFSVKELKKKGLKKLVKMSKLTKVLIFIILEDQLVQIAE